MITWCFLNKLINQRTMIVLHIQDSTIQSNDIKAILRSLGQMFPESQLIPTRMDDLINSPRIAKGSLFINIGVEPSKHHLGQGMTLTSDKTDALCFSGIEENLVLSIDQVTQNTWQEVMAYRYTGEKGILDCLGSYFQVSPPSQKIAPPTVACHCFTTGRGMAIASRIQELFTDVSNCFYGNNMPDTTRYIVRIGKNFHALTFEQDIFNHRMIGSYSKLLRYLSEASGQYSPVMIDRYALVKSPLAIIFRNNKPDSIQIFYTIEGTSIDVYVVDEKGSLFFQSIKNTAETVFLNQYSRFLQSVIHKQEIHLMSPSNTSSQGKINQLNFFLMVKNKKGEMRLIPREYDEVSQAQNFYNLHVVADILEGGETTFTLYCNNKEFTSLEFGDQVFKEVAKDVLSHRKSGSSYPIHITDIEFSRPQMGKDATAYLQTVYFLIYKRSIEENLNQALMNSSGNQAQA
jgi:adenylate cyclase class 1